MSMDKKLILNEHESLLIDEALKSYRLNVRSFINSYIDDIEPMLTQNGYRTENIKLALRQLDSIDTLLYEINK